MARCRETKPDGTPCERIVPSSQDYCYSHDPARKEERRRNASRAGKSRPNREFSDIKEVLYKLTCRVLAGTIPPGPAAVANQITNTRLRAIDLERRIREQEELEARIEELEKAAEQRKEGQPWGA